MNIFLILLLFILIFILYVCKCGSSYGNKLFSSLKALPSECDFNSPYYAPTNIKTAGDTSPVGQLIKAFVNTTLKKQIPTLKNMQITIGSCPPSSIDDMQLCGIGADFGVGSIYVTNIKNLISNLNIAPLAQIQSFPSYPDITAVSQTVYAVLPISFSIDIYLDIHFTGVPVPNFDNVRITVAGCSSVFLTLQVQCPSKTKTLINELNINPLTKINKLSIDIHDTTLNDIVNIGTYLAATDLSNMLTNIINARLQDSLFPNISNLIKNEFPYTLPLPACLNVPGNIIKNSKGQIFSGIYGYRPNLYPAPSSKDTRWMKCTFACAMAGVGQHQQCLDACVDYVESSRLDTPKQCAENPNPDGYFFFNDRSVVKDGVTPNGPLWRGVCNSTTPEDRNLIPDINSGYSWWQSSDLYYPPYPIEGIPSYKGYKGVRNKKLGEYTGTVNGIDMCTYNCMINPNCKSLDMATKTQGNVHEGDCFIKTDNDSEVVQDDQFNHYFPVT